MIRCRQIEFNQKSMRKIFPIIVLILTLAYPTLSFSHGMTDDDIAVSENGGDHTAREEAEGKEIQAKLSAGEAKCENLSDEDFGTLGEYFMGQMMGETHKDMNDTMILMMGEEGEEEMHVAMGKRMSQCEPNAAMPQNMMNGGMMQMMMGGSMMSNSTNSSALNNFDNPMSMMDFGYAPLGWIFMVLFWVLIIAGIVALIKWIAGQNGTGKSALDILKEKYAKGEINKKEFEGKKKDLN